MLGPRLTPHCGLLGATTRGSVSAPLEGIAQEPQKDVVATFSSVSVGVR